MVSRLFFVAADGRGPGSRVKIRTVLQHAFCKQDILFSNMIPGSLLSDDYINVLMKYCYLEAVVMCSIC